MKVLEEAMATKKLARVIKAVTTAALLLGPAMVSASAQSAGDIRLLQMKVAAAQGYFAKAWSETFRSQGKSFAAPRINAFSRSALTGCHDPESRKPIVVPEGNGYFCREDNTIYLDVAFLAQEMATVAKALGTDGDYAAILIAAHEFGHVVAAQSKADVIPSVLVPIFGSENSEQKADCFAGVITRQAKRDKLLEAGDLEEAVFELGRAGDEGTGSVVDKIVKLSSMRVQQAQTTGADDRHGLAKERQSAFLEGYYGGGAGFCGFGTPKPPASGRVLAPVPGSRPPSIAPGIGLWCVSSTVPGGLQIRNTADRECMFTMLPDGTKLPDHVRIELTVTRLTNKTTGLGSTPGIYYGDARSTAALTHFGFDTYVWKNPQPRVGQAGLSAVVELVNMDQKFEQVDIFRISEGATRGLPTVSGENKLMLDIHHEGKDVYFLEYVNGRLASSGQWRGTQASRQGAADHAGVLLRKPGDEAIFKDFRVTELPN